MPCERKHVEAIRNNLDAYFPFFASHGIELHEVYIAISAALAACDESPCVWSSGWRANGQECRAPGCMGKWPEYAGSWDTESFSNMTYCPYCGRKIAPLPAAPEVGK